ncbi:hypothetical protein AVEN_91330-1 [Araneus ventricosus]|uniref:Uncharacterized protein n=1 Tax=Araneus ventricosus TaxID=182803 RepID=A0A4Y2L9D3_ARAVE|nr:hypothetical protein AVEN_91330-1 [Araneus ventricosus]
MNAVGSSPLWSSANEASIQGIRSRYLPTKESYTKTTGDDYRNFKPGSNDKDDALAQTTFQRIKDWMIGQKSNLPFNPLRTGARAATSSWHARVTVVLKGLANRDVGKTAQYRFGDSRT